MNTKETKAAQDEASRRKTIADSALAKIRAALDPENTTATRAEIEKARSEFDDALAERNEAVAALDAARRDHDAAEKAEELTRLRVAEDACKETPALLEKEFRAIAAQRDRLCKHASQIHVVLTAHAQNAARARELGAKLGEATTVRDIPVGIVAALALQVVSEASEHSDFDTAQIVRWLLAISDPTARAEQICRFANPTQARPAEITLAAAAKMYLDTLDDQVLALAVAKREGLISAAARAQAERAEAERVAQMTPQQLRQYRHDVALYGQANAPAPARANGASA